MPDSTDKHPAGSATHEIAARTAALRYEDLPQDVVEWARQTLLDWFGVTLAGSREELARILRDEAVEQGGRPVATVVGGDFKTGTQQAALVNGATAHALDYDDAHFLATVHSGVVTISGMLALAEERGASGRDFVTALAAGFEAVAAVAAFVGDKHYRLGFHSTGTIGSFGSAAACANLMRLDAATTATAFGIAAAQAAGIRSMFGTMTKPFHAGKAAQNGLIAANLAARGFTSNSHAIEAALGFGATHSPDFDPARKIAPPPMAWSLRYNIFKFHAACFLTHAPIECALDLRDRQGVAADKLAKVTLHIESGARDVCGIVTPRSGLEAKFSLKQCLALVFAGLDTASLDTFGDARAADPALAALRDRVVIDYSPDIKRGRAEIDVTMSDGRRLTAQFDSGKPVEDLARQRARVQNKFLRLAEPVLGQRRATELAALAIQIETVHSMRELTALCGPKEGM
jgi:2-methylcitrate dehydratase PrpD